MAQWLAHVHKLVQDLHRSPLLRIITYRAGRDWPTSLQQQFVAKLQKGVSKGVGVDKMP